MSNVDLNEMSLKELHAVAEQAQQTIEKKRKDGVKELRKKILQDIKDNGLTLGDVFPALKGKTRGPVAPKYANPADETETWTGRGRKPKWVEAELSSGKTLEDISI